MSHLRMTEAELMERANKLRKLLGGEPLPKDVAQRIIKQTKVAAPAKNKQSKFHNVSTEVDGIKFASKKEAKRWQELLLLQKSGVITNLERQYKFELLPSLQRSDGTKERPVSYVADFVYGIAAERRGVPSLAPLVVEDSKGVRTPDYIIKRKLLLFRYGITIKET